MKVSGRSGSDFPRVFADGRLELPDAYRLAGSGIFPLGHYHQQIQTILGYVGQFGETLAGLGWVPMKLPQNRVLTSGRTDKSDDHG